MDTALVPECIRRPIVMRVLAEPLRVEHNAGMLDVAFRIVELCADGSDAVVKFEGRRHLFQPAWRETIDVVVEEQQEGAAGRLHGGVVHGREIEGATVREHPEPVRRRLAGKKVEQLRLV